MAHPLVDIDPVSAPYWDALMKNELHFQRCQTCRHAQLPPRMHCTECLSSDIQWERASGAAELLSWVVYHTVYNKFFEGKVPYNVALVKLDEGPSLIANIAGVSNSDLKIGLRLIFLTENVNGQNLVRFKPEAGT